MTKILLTLFVLLFALSCKREGNTHFLLLGAWSDPDYEILNEGEVYGGDNSVGVFTTGEFGELFVFHDGVEVGHFSRGAVVIYLDGDHDTVELSGMFDQNMVLLLFKNLGNNKSLLINKDMVEKTDEFHWKYDVPGANVLQNDK